MSMIHKGVGVVIAGGLLYAGYNGIQLENYEAKTEEMGLLVGIVGVAGAFASYSFSPTRNTSA